jgi:dTDP-L-rhamnose 4-epimerase
MARAESSTSAAAKRSPRGKSPSVWRADHEQGRDRPRISGRYRVGDVRHCFADVSAAQAILGYQPKVSLEPGLTDLAGWLEGQLADDHVESASAELAMRGLTL